MIEYETGRCVIGDKPHSATRGYLCSSHFEQLGTMLRDVEDEAALLTATPSMQQRTGNRGGGLASQRTPVRLEVVVHNDPRSRRYTQPAPGPACYHCWHETCMAIRNWDDSINANAAATLSILNTLHSCARLVREERRISLPDSVTVSGERDLLTRNLDWIAAQPWVDEFSAVLRDLLGQLRSANGTRPDRPYSHCPSIVAGEPCTGEVWIHDELQPVWRRYPDRCAQTWEQAPGSAVCDTCAATWTTPAEKAYLKRMIDDAATELARPRTEDGVGMRTAQEIANEHDVKVGTIPVWAHRRGIVSTGGYYDPRAFRDKATA